METKNQIQELFERYVEECRFQKRLRPETVRGYTEVFKTLLAIVPEIQSLEDLTSEMITLFFKRLQTRSRLIGKTSRVTGIKESTVRTYGSKLHSFFAWLVQKGLMEKNPINKSMLPVPVFEDHRALKRGEVEKIISTIMQYSINALVMRRDLLMVYILTFCGLRRNELLMLQVRDIDLDKSLITVRAETSKSKVTRHLRLHKTVRIHLAEYMKERRANRVTTEYLFVGNGRDERFTCHGLKHWVKRVSQLSGVRFHVHRFRHTFATNLAHADVGAVKIQKLMGHKSLNMTSKYLRSMNAEDLSDEIDGLSIEGLA